MTERLFIGVMSGTSCDGVDAVLMRVDGRGPAMRATFLRMESVEYAREERLAIQSARDNKLNLRDLTTLGRDVAHRYADAVGRLLKSGDTAARDVTALSAHGQTIYHAPPLTWQLFDPTVLAARVGVDVISDFRRADCAVGGQGAPLVPFGDWVMFRDRHPRVLINLGGIANITCLPGGGRLHDVWGMDVGPGNCLSDWLMRQHGGVDGDGRYVGLIDVGGALALKGRVLHDVATVVLNDDYFHTPGPKSTDIPHMTALFRHALNLWPSATLESKLATANFIAASALCEHIEAHAGRLLGFDRRVNAEPDDDWDADWDLETPEALAVEAPDDETFGQHVGRLGLQCFVAGGGVHNADLMRQIDLRFTTRRTDKLGVPSQAREAAAFAVLAAAFVDRFPAYMPRVTGAGRPAVLGSLTPATR